MNQTASPAAQTSAVTVIEQPVDAAMVEWNLDSFPEDKFNRLLPTQTLSIPTDLLRPVVQVVKLNPDPNGGDVYSSKDMPDGHSAPTKVGLRKLATAAGISFLDERRTDDGTNPDVIEVTCLAEMLLPTGVRIHATGIKRVDLAAQVWKSDAHRGKFKSFFLEHVASRAQNRAIRALLSIRGSYPTQIYNRPFAVVSYAPNMGHPEIRERFLAGLEGTAAQLYGGKAAPKQVGPGPGVVNAPQAPEDDAAPAASSPVEEEPEWVRQATGAGKAQKPDFAAAIRAFALETEDPEALPSKEDLDKLAGIFAGWDDGVIKEGLRVLWPDTPISKLAGGQARAIARACDSLGAEDFAGAWKRLTEAEAGS